MQIVPGIHAVDGEFGGRHLFQHLLLGEERMLLVDSGIVTTPEETIFPYLEELGHRPSDVSYVISTHPDTDHFGGNAVVRAAAPACRILAHKLDRRWLEDPDRMVAERYDGFRADHGVGDPQETLDELRSLCGDPTPIDVALCGDEWVHLGDGWSVQILHTPGHSEGHLSVWDPRTRSLVIGDAAMGYALPYADGSPALAATYTHPGPYVETARRLSEIRADHLLTAHFPPMHGEDAMRFLDDTREHVDATEELLVETIGAAAEPPTLADLIPVVDAALGPLPAAAVGTWASPIVGHLDELEASGRIVASRDAANRKTWSLA